MPLKIIHPHHAEVMGRGLVLLSSPHITAAKRDLYAGQIVEEAALLSKSWAKDGSESEEILDIIKSGIEPHFRLNPDANQSGNRLSGSPTYDGPADGSSTHSVNIIQIELGPEERSFRKDQIVNIVADIVGLINAKLGFSESGSGVQD